jgi:hypothetical protein
LAATLCLPLLLLQNFATHSLIRILRLLLLLIFVCRWWNRSVGWAT